MREIHHRVKNNLQMINSMVRLQSRYINATNAENSLKEVERRIQTMALLHEKMYQSDNLVAINIKEYITNVIEDLLSIYKAEKNINYRLDIADINYKTETILYQGLLINELITNTLKHAFKNRTKGHIAIKLHNKNANQYILKITNDGETLDINNFNTSKSLGHRLIKNFVKQLNGSLEISNNPKTSFTIKFDEF